MTVVWLLCDFYTRKKSTIANANCFVFDPEYGKLDDSELKTMRAFKSKVIINYVLI